MENKKSMSMFTARDIAVIGLMIALKVVLTRFLAVETQFVRVGFSFIPTILLAIMYGPWVGAFSGALADVAGFFLFPKGFAFSPGFTISAAVAPIIYGMILYRKPLTLNRIMMACLAVTVIVNVGMNSLWLRILYDQAFSGMLPIRLAQNIITLPIEVGIMYWVLKNASIKRAMKDYSIHWIN